MYSLSPSQLLTLWEHGSTQTTVERAITILTAAMPMSVSRDLKRLVIGDRNLHLLNIREHLFGKRLNCVLRCHHCSEPIEFILNTDELKTEPKEIPEQFLFTLENNQYQFRLMNSYDLAMSALQIDLIQAELKLIERCLVTVNEQEFTAAMLSDLSATTIEELSKQLRHCDPNAEFLIHLTCPGCNETWQTAFDIADFLWHEIVRRAKQLLTEVHQLASVYGWHEVDILALSESRRQYYLQQIS